MPLALLLALAQVPSRPTLRFADAAVHARLGVPFERALDNLLTTNTVPYDPKVYDKTGLLTGGRFVRAGGGYGQPWTRDAAINSWSAASLFEPAAAHDTLLSVTVPSPEGPVVQRDNQWWDKVVWVVGAWDHYRTTGDRAFLGTAYGVAQRLLREQRNERYDADFGLFRGAVVLQRRHRGLPRAARPGRRLGEQLRPRPSRNRPDHGPEHQLPGRRRVPRRGRDGERTGPAPKGVDPRRRRVEEGRRSPLLDAGTAIVRLPALPRRPPRPVAGGLRPRVRRPVRRRVAGVPARRGRAGLVPGERRPPGEGRPLRGDPQRPDGTDGDRQSGHAWESAPDQTWSATAYLSMVTNGLFGMRFEPLVLSRWGEVALDGVPFRAATLDIRLKGTGTKTTVRLDGKPVCLVPGDLRGRHTVEIDLR